MCPPLEPGHAFRKWPKWFCVISQAGRNGYETSSSFSWDTHPERLQPSWKTSDHPEGSRGEGEERGGEEAEDRG